MDAIKLIANDSKRLGLLGYSSHQFSVSVESELSVADDIAAESTRLYQILQTTVDEQMLRTLYKVANGNMTTEAIDESEF